MFHKKCFTTCETPYTPIIPKTLLENMIFMFHAIAFHGVQYNDEHRRRGEI